MNKDYVWAEGDYDLEALFVEEDVTAEAEAIQDSVRIDALRLLRVLQTDEQPVVPEGTSCSTPYGCPYLELCPVLDDPPEHPVGELPNASKAVVRRAAEKGFDSLLEMDEIEARQILTYADGRPHEGWYCTWRVEVAG